MNENQSLNYNNQYNSIDTNSESINLSLIKEKSKNFKYHYNYRNRSRTLTCLSYPYKKIQNNGHPPARLNSLLKPNLKKMKNKFNLGKVGRCQKFKSCLKHENLKKNFHVEKNKRPKSVKSSFSALYSSFNNILIEYIPVTAKIINVPKNRNLDTILKKIDVNIDRRTFICLKYNKKKGVLFIKFRNKFYFNYYYYYFKDKSIYKNYPPLIMTKIEESINLWRTNPKEEEIKRFPIFHNRDEENNFNYFYITLNFKRIFS